MKQLTLSFLLAAVLSFGLAAGPACASTNLNQPPRAPRFVRDAGQARFAKSIEDLPVMDGLEVETDEDVLFVFQNGRIAQTTMKGRVDIDDVYYFYQKTLPSLGWKQLSMRLYERGDELLHLDASSANSEGITFVRFALEPRSQVPHR